MDNLITISPVPVLSDNYVWLLELPEGRVVVIDPGEAEPVVSHLDRHGLELAAVLLTHHHQDHTAGAPALVTGSSAPVFGPAREHIAGVTNPVEEGDRVELSGLELEVWEVPGHTAGHVAYLGHGMVFSGDTLFVGGCGRLFEGTAEQMWESLSRLARLPSSTRVYCAHEYTVANLRFARQVEPDNQNLEEWFTEASLLREQGAATVPSTIGLERRTNPFLRVEQETVITAASRHSGRSLQGGVEVFAEVRRWKDGWQ